VFIADTEGNPIMNISEWLTPYEADIRSDNDLAVAVANDLSQGIDVLRPILDNAFSPLSDGTLDPGDVEKMAEILWDHLGAQFLKMEKQRVESQRRLEKLYTYLTTAPEEEWEQYAKFLVGLRAEVMARLWLLSGK
jgi:hypothetical protein